MKYFLSLFHDETAMPPSPQSEAELQEMLQPYRDFRNWCNANQVKILSGDALASAGNATTLRHGENGERVVTDGPFLEIKEQLGGFYLIECEHIDLALAAAKQVPFLTGCEVRPVIDFGV